MTPKGDDEYSGNERRTEARSTRPFELVRYFSIASAVAFVVAIALVATVQFWASKKDLVALAEIETVELGQTISNTAWPEIALFLEMTAMLDDEALRSRPETRHIHEALERVTRGLSVLKIKIYNLDGRTLFSTDTKEIGEDKSGNPGFVSAAKQRKPASKLSRKGSISAFSGVMFNRDVVETYLPVYGPSGAIEGVFELYTDVSRTIGAVHTMVREIVFSMVAAFGLLYLLLYLIVRRADRILHEQSLDIGFKAAAIAAKNADLEREIVERKQIEGRLEGAVQSLQEAFVFFDADDRLAYCNAEYRRMHPLGQEMVKPGVKFEDLIRANVERGNVADAIGREEEYIRERMARHRNPKNPIVRQLTDGRSVIIYETRTPDGGTCQTMTDVTAIRRAAEAVRLSEDRLRGAVAAIQEGFAYYDADDRLVLFNDEYRHLHRALADILKPGMRFEELMRTAIERGTIPDAVGREEDYIRERMDRHRDPKGPILRTLADGTRYVINESRTPDGGIVVTEIDVTERHRAEQALTLSESRLRGAIESLQEGFALCDAEDRVVAVNAVYQSWNPFAWQTLEKGGTFEDMLRANVASGAIADAIGREEDFIRERMQQHRNPKGPIVRRFSDGRWSMIRETRTPEGGIALTFTDITDLKRAEEALKEGERALRAVIDSVPAMVNAKDRDFRYIFMNEYQAILYGTTPEQAVGKTASDILGPEYGRYTQAIDAEVLAKNRGRYNYEENWVDRAGTPHVLLTTKVPLADEAGKPNCVVTVALDITDRKHAEQAQRESDLRLRGAINSMQEGFVLLDADDRLVAVNDLYLTFNPDAKAILERAGTFEDLVRANVRRGAVADAIGREEEFMRERMEQHRNLKGPILRRYTDGRWFIVTETKTPDGGIAITFSDVTNLKRAEEALRESEQRLKSIIDSVPAMINVKDTESRYLLSNRYHLDLLGIEEGELLGKAGGYFMPEHASLLREMELRTMATGKALPSYDETLRGADGREYQFMLTKAPLRDLAGKIVGTVTAGIDVTHRRKLEEAVEAERRRLVDAVESLQESFALFDAADRVVALNDNYRRINPDAQAIMERGGTYEDMLRANVKRGILVEAIGREEEFIAERLARHRNPRGPIIRSFADGRWFIIKEAKTPEGGIALTFSDVTGLKRAEDALRESEKRLKTIIDSVPAIINVKDTEFRYVLCNRYLSNLVGIDEADMLGKPTGFLLPKYGTLARRVERRVMETGGVVRPYDVTLGGADGKERQFMLTKAPLRDLAGKIVGTVTAGIDITERRKLEDAVEAERRRMVDAIESIEGGAILYDADDRIVLCNSTYRQHLSAVGDILVPGTRFEDVIRAVARAGTIEEAIADPDKYVRERIARHRALEPSLIHLMKTDRWVLIREYRTSDGGTLIIRTDVTEQKRIEEALRASEQQLRTIMESSPIGIAVVLPAENKRLYVNPAMVNLYGAESVEQMLAGRMSDSFVNPEDFRRLQEGTGKNFIPDAVVQRKRLDGSTWWCLLVRRPIVYQGKEAMMVWNWDITDRKRAEEALRASEQRFMDIAESASDWFWEMGPDLRFTFASDRFFQRTGLHPEDIIGKTRTELVGRELVRENPEMWRAHEKILKDHKPFRNFEYSQWDADGFMCHVRVSGKPIFDDDGGFLGYRGVATDITEYRRTERELTHHKRMESLGNLAGGIAHNLNNLLQPILILSQLTGDALVKSSVEHQNLQFINQAAVRAKELVDRILTFSREKSYQLKSADICDIVREELDLIHSIVPSTITINEKLDENTGTVLVDALQTQTVLMNIVANAVDAIDGKPGILDISLSRARVGTTSRNAVPTLRKGDYAKLTISDNGHGMDEKTLGRIFDPFFTTKEPGKGTGLGLSTAFGIVVKHGGTIRASSTPGKRTTFDVYFPLIKGDGG